MTKSAIRSVQHRRQCVGRTAPPAAALDKWNINMYTNIIPIIEEDEVKIAIGLMSGTSRDGIDAAMIRTDGLYTVEQMGFWFEPYPAETKSQIAGACNLAASYNRPQSHPIIDQCQAVLNDNHLRAASALIREVGISSNEVSIIGLHGHTIAHRADKGGHGKLATRGFWPTALVLM